MRKTAKDNSFENVLAGARFFEVTLNFSIKGGSEQL